jgi:hypothetical protein
VFSCSNFFLLTSTPAASLRFSFPFEWRRPSTAQSTVILACRPRDRSVCFFFSAGLVRGSAFRQLGSVSGFHSALRFSPLSSPAQERGQDPFPLCVLSSCAPNFLLREDLFRCQQCRRSGFPSTRIFTVGYSRFSGLIVSVGFLLLRSVQCHLSVSGVAPLLVPRSCHLVCVLCMKLRQVYWCAVLSARWRSLACVRQRFP